MTSEASLALVRRRLRDQRLGGEGLERPADVVSWLGAMQAQEYAEAKWSIGERLRAGGDADVEAAFDRGEILRTHLMRPTWHFVARADIRWLLRLTAPRVHAVNRYWYGRSGLDGALLARSHDVLADAVRDGEPRTRKELVAALERAGIEASGLRLGYILMHAELEELLCSGPRQGRQQTYARLDDRAPGAVALPRERALEELARRYFTSHGPASVRDFVWWSGLTVADATQALERAGAALARSEAQDGSALYAAPDPLPGPRELGAFLIPMFDETLMGYKERRVALAAPPPRENLLERPIVIEGRTVGSWSRTLASRAVSVRATLFTPLDAGQEAQLDAAVARFGRFLGLPATLTATVAVP